MDVIDHNWRLIFVTATLAYVVVTAAMVWQLDRAHRTLRRLREWESRQSPTASVEQMRAGIKRST